MLARIGALVFALGTIVGITAAAKPPPKVGGWPDTLHVFVVAVIVAITGLVVWRRGRAAEAEQPRTGTAPEAGPFELIDAASESAATLGGEIGGLGAGEITRRVDALLEGYVLPIADGRQRIIDRLGMARGAEILVTMAYAERMLNRVWSAAGDGHLGEARRVYPDALAALEEAGRQAKAAREAAR